MDKKEKKKKKKKKKKRKKKKKNRSPKGLTDAEKKIAEEKGLNNKSRKSFSGPMRDAIIFTNDQTQSKIN